MFEKMLIDEPDNWQPIEEQILREELTGYYRNIDEVIFYLFNGGKARTPWAYYRYTKEQVQL